MPSLSAALLCAQLIQLQNQPGRDSNLLLARFNAAFDYYHVLLKKQNNSSFIERFGLYRSNILIIPYQKLLDKILVQLFLQPTATILETRLNNYSKLWQQYPTEHEAMRGDYYANLRSYLMLCLPQYTDISATILLAKIWLSNNNHINSSAALSSTNAIAIVRYYLQELMRKQSSSALPLAWPANANLISTVRQQLYNPFKYVNIYAYLVSRCIQQFGYLTFINCYPM